MNVRELARLIEGAGPNAEVKIEIRLPDAGLSASWLEVTGADADDFTSTLTLRADLRCEDFVGLPGNYGLVGGICDANATRRRWEEAEQKMLDCIGDEE
ncbi:hypothetical protein [Olsenella sp. Marseille-P4559]|jgi:hypothetical protein|uniref:hypothetical protein n=1 Tax=Olsenella sp. Marseille-P4559 TaxID=2364795 RepID=UPI00102F41DC|nr:hypothetical protein [Olsenella sp. Marseille-P4559]